LQDENQKLKDTIASQQSAPTISPTTTSSPTPVAEPTGNETIQLNSPVTIADICEFKVTKARFTDKVNPPNTDSYYSYYEVKDKNNTYLDIVIS
jgi:type V secretory pathway adhesin AidA